MARITNKDLQRLFNINNHRYFEDQIDSGYTVKFEKSQDDGFHIPSVKKISINADLRRHPDLALLVLLHEMAHASLPEYRGAEDQNTHGMLFQAKLVELFNKGAYDGIL